MKKHNLLFLPLIQLLGLCASPALAQNAAYSDALISRLNPSSAAAFGSRTRPGHSCITGVLMDAKRNAPQLTAEAKTALKPFEDRIALADEEVMVTGHFNFHYTQSGGDAVPTTDANNNNLPDYVESMSAVFESVYTQYQNRSYTMPPDDGTAGGSTLYDVYIADIGWGLYGFVAPEDLIGNNPKSAAITETDAYTSWMGMNIDYSWSGISDLSAVQVTAAHEFFHAVQMGTTLETTNFIAEATATWAEDEIYPGIDDNFQYLGSIFETPDVALSLNSDDDPWGAYGGHWYGAWIYFRYLSEHSSPDIIRRIYHRCITTDEMTAIDAEASASGLTGLMSTFGNFWLANALLTSSASYAPYTYTRANDYSAATGITEENQLIYTGTSFTYSSTSQGNGTLMRMGADYFPLSASKNFKVTLQVPGGEGVTMLLLKKNSQNSTYAVATPTLVSGNAEITVDDALLYNSFHLMVLRDDRSATDLQSAQYTLSFAPRPATGTEDDQHAAVRVYPNPAAQSLRIEATSGQVLGAVLTDMNGKELLASDKAALDVSSVAAGIYLVRVTTSEGTAVQRVEVLR